MDLSEAGTGKCPPPKTVISSSIKTLPITFNKRVLHQKYVLERRSLRQIAAEFASAKTCVREALLKFGIPLREPGKNPVRAYGLPIGKRSVNGRVILHKGEQRTIESILMMHREGLSNRAIARTLTTMKVPTKQQGKQWHHETVGQILLRNKRKRSEAVVHRQRQGRETQNVDQNDGLLALIFTSMVLFGASTIFNVVKRAALERAAHGLGSLHKFQSLIDGKHFNWEEDIPRSERRRK